MRVIVFALFVLFAAPAHVSAQSCNVPGCEAATAQVAQGRATARAILTESAPRSTATPEQPTIIYMAQTVTVRETVIITQIVTQTVEVIATAAPVALPDIAPPEQPSVTAAPAAPIERVSPIVFVGMVIGALAGLIGAAYFAYRFIFPARDDDHGTQWVQTKKKK